MSQSRVIASAFSRTLVTDFRPGTTTRETDGSSDAEKHDQQVPIKFYPTKLMLVVTHGEVVAGKLLSTTDHLSYALDLCDQDLLVVTTHAATVTCIGVTDESWLICSCSEDKVILSKFDALLKTFSSSTIGVDFGRILSCALVVRGDLIFTCLVKVNELVLIRSTSHDSPLTEFGFLCLTSIEITASLDRISEPVTWLQLLFFKDVLHVIGITTGNAVSVKIWEISPEGHFQLKDHRSTSQSRNVSGVDLVRTTTGSDEYNLVIVSPEGHCELLAVKSNGFDLLSRIKLEDFGPGVEVSLNCGDTNANNQLDFRIFSARFLSESEPQEDDDLIEELTNTLTKFDKCQVVCPKVLVLFATTKGILVLNFRSGETQLIQRYGDFLPSDGLRLSNTVLANAKIWNASNSAVILAFQPIDSKVVYTMQLEIQIVADTVTEDLTLCTTKEVEAKSVLRKKLKSPHSSPLTTKKRSTNSRMSLYSRRSASMDSFALRKTHAESSKLQLLSSTTTKLRKSSVISKASVATRQKTYSSATGTDNDTSPCSARTVRVTIPKKPYDEYGNLFSDTESKGFYIKTRLSTLSHMRMSFSTSGNELAVGGNVAPVIICRTHPQFETLCLLKDSRKVMSLQFSFTDSQHLLIATNDGKTEIVNWRLEKQVLGLQFTSKFNEHVHSQFYYLDRFILQPEDNQIVLYSFRIQAPTSVTAKAGSFKVNSQQITALAAPNQFYSSTVLCGGSNKSLIAFDTNTEQEFVTISNAHSKPISVIRINEAPKGFGAPLLCDLVLTAANTHVDPIKIWDLRIAKCATRIGDVNSQGFVPTSRPGFSPCGKYIASGFEENTIAIYDIRKVNAKVTTLRGMRVPVLDTLFDPNFSLLWSACRDGKIWNFRTN